MLSSNLIICDFETTGIADDDIPIEVGLIYCDQELNIRETFQSFINPGCPRQDLVTQERLRAFKVHGIMPEDIMNAPAPEWVADRVREMCKRATMKNSRKPVLTSDNIRFEWLHMKKLIKFFDGQPSYNIVDSFHYCGWDSTLLLDATGVGDPKPAHRALADAGLLHAALVKAMDRTRNLRNK